MGQYFPSVAESYLGGYSRCREKRLYTGVDRDRLLGIAAYGMQSLFLMFRGTYPARSPRRITVKGPPS
jgi:hypothetical protein